jgi:hypothetical protein
VTHLVVLLFHRFVITITRAAVGGRCPTIARLLSCARHARAAHEEGDREESRPRSLAPPKHVSGFLASPVPALAAPRARDRRSRGEGDVSRHRALARGETRACADFATMVVSPREHRRERRRTMGVPSEFFFFFFDDKHVIRFFMK